MQHYEDTCKITCTDNDNTVVAEVLEYKPSQMLTASLNRQVKVTLRFNEASKDYRGAAAGMQFQSTGPTEIATTRSRR